MSGQREASPSNGGRATAQPREKRKRNMTKHELIEFTELLLDRIRNDRYRELSELYYSDAAITKHADSLKDDPTVG